MRRKTGKTLSILLIALAITLISSSSFAQSFTTVNYYRPSENYNYSNYRINPYNFTVTYKTTYNTFGKGTPIYVVPSDTNTTNNNNTNTTNNNNTNTTNNNNTNTTNNNNTATDSARTFELEVARLVNIERAKEGLSPLSFSDELSKVARAKSQDMAAKNYFNHVSPTYGDPFAMMKSFGISYRTAGENIAKGYYSAESVVNGWMNSSGHRANILNGSFNKIGVGYAVGKNGTPYWTQMFTD